MVKERFVESYGEPTYAIATGGSGGSYQSHQTADNYPGVFDGIIVSSSFPDVTSATIFTLADARLLSFYFTEIAPRAFSEEEQRPGFGVRLLGEHPQPEPGRSTDRCYVLGDGIRGGTGRGGEPPGSRGPPLQLVES